MLCPRNWCFFMQMGLVYFKVVAWVSLSKFNHNLFHSWLMFTTWHIRQFWLSKPSCLICGQSPWGGHVIILQMFFQLSKRLLKLTKLGEVMETNGLKSWTMSRLVEFLCWTYFYECSKNNESIIVEDNTR
jgi:hypothetical protein